MIMRGNRSIHQLATLRSARRSRRTGLSLLEFLGCLMALVGGAWLGAIYIGIDVHRLAYVALTESDLLEKVPEDWRPQPPEGFADAPTPAELAQAVQGELVALRHEITALRSERDPADSLQVATSNGGVHATSDNSSRSAQRETCLAFWNRLAEIVRDELALQFDAESAASDGNATKVAALKGRISRFASTAIAAVPTEGVDPAEIQLSQELAGWYERGGELYEKAVRIWESPSRGQSGHTLTKDWEQAHLQHLNEGKLLREKVAAVRDSLTRRFGSGFAEFETP